MLMLIDMRLLDPDKQPKHSWRYGYEKGDGGVESVYIKKTALSDPPPEVLCLSLTTPERLALAKKRQGK